MDRVPQDEALTDELERAGARLRNDVGSGPTPALETLELTHRQRVRRRTARVGVAAATVAVIAVGGTVFVQRDGGSDEVAADATTTVAPAGSSSVDGGVAGPAEPSIELREATDCRSWTSQGFDLDAAQLADGVPRSQDALYDTAVAVGAYAESQPDYVAHGFENLDGGSLVVAVFTEDLDRHLTELRAVVPYADSVVVRGAPATLARMQEVQSEIGALPIDEGAARMTGPRWDGLFVGLRADQLPLAEQIAAEYGSIIHLTVGVKQYTGTGTGELARCPEAPSAASPLPAGERLPAGYGVEVDPENSVIAGQDLSIDVSLSAPVAWTWQPDGPDGEIDAVVVRPGTDEVVTSSEGTMRRMVLPGPISVPPGQLSTIRLSGPTSSVDASDDPALAPGAYELVATISIDGAEYRLPRIPLTVTPG